ncbi:hypothetical protein HZB94_03190 [Candidatus Falkowbacteria bacterium]|nr:hypothetical protein [Candidatus Falkowbacteria bacterium]
MLGEKNVFGPEEVEKTWGVRLEEAPDIPFFVEELERARELGQFLILRVDKAPDGQPLTMKKMNELLEDKFKGNKRKILYNADWYKNEEFYTTDAPELHWALVSRETIPNSTNKNYLQQMSRETIPNSTNKNYLQQTQELVRYLTDKVFKAQPISTEYQEAIDEFERYYRQEFRGKTEQQIQELLSSSNWSRYAQGLSDLKINQLFRQMPVEVLYDMLMYFEASGRLLERNDIWTNRRSSSGLLVRVDSFSTVGAHVAHWSPGSSDAGLGVVFSRSH